MINGIVFRREENTADFQARRGTAHSHVHILTDTCRATSKPGR